VYLGLALLLVVSLHAGFQFGWNIHTLCYVLMVVVIASGLLGIVLYQRLPQQLSQNRAQQTSEQMLTELQELDERTRRVAANASSDEALAIEANIAGTRIGGSTVAILSAKDRSTVRLPGGSAEAEANPGQARILEWLSARLSASDDAGPRRQRVPLLVSRRCAYCFDISPEPPQARSQCVRNGWMTPSSPSVVLPTNACRATTPVCN